MEPFHDKVVLPLDKFAKWIHCICVVTFDLELGQAMELISPKHIKLTDTEKTNISYLAFPDSHSGCMGNTQYHFRIRTPSVKRHFVQHYSEFDANCPTHMRPHATHSFGFVFFRQVRDKSIRRGYFQKSVVVLTPLPFVPLFNRVTGIIAPDYFKNGPVSLEVACHDIDQWPAPECGTSLQLPLMGTVFQVTIPARTDRLLTPPQTGSPRSCIRSSDQTSSNSTDSASVEEKVIGEGGGSSGSSDMITQVLHSVHEVGVYKSFLPVLPHLQVLWELVLTSQPILIMATTPTQSSQAVQALANAISPLSYATEYRPFFTIHDSEFKEFTTKTQAPPPVILGVTNPFFSKALMHWPNIIRLCDDGAPVPLKERKIKKTNGLFKHEEAKPGLYSRYKPFLTPDAAIYKKIKKGIQQGRPVEIQDLIIRRFFLEMTQSFMIPLERYVASLMPLQRCISPFKCVPCMSRFIMDDFFKSLERSGPQLTSGTLGNWVGLYRQFLSGPNFAAWLTQRQTEVNTKLQELHIDVLCRVDLTTWMQTKREVELVDMLIQLNGKLHLSKSRSLQLSVAQETGLRHQIDTIMAALPEDLRVVLRQSSSGTGAAVSVPS